jgi:hypothetical protein
VDGAAEDAGGTTSGSAADGWLADGDSQGIPFLAGAASAAPGWAFVSACTGAAATKLTAWARHQRTAMRKLPRKSPPPLETAGIYRETAPFGHP